MKKAIIIMQCMMMIFLVTQNAAAQKNTAKDDASGIREKIEDNAVKAIDLDKEVNEFDKKVASPVLKVESGKIYQFRNRTDIDFKFLKPVEIKSNLNFDTFHEKDDFIKPSVELVPATKKGDDKKQ